jgi:uncharacterized protein YjbI with pentapeptide repeats
MKPPKMPRPNNPDPELSHPAPVAVSPTPSNPKPVDIEPDKPNHCASKMETVMPGDCKPASPDCSRLREAVDDAAGVTGTLWLSFIFLLFYVLLAVVGVTHADQFLQNNVELPFLQIKLPMLGFFWVGPIIVLLAHAYVLHHLTLLADTARELNECNPDPSKFDSALLGISLFAQMLAGPAKTKDASAWWVEQIIVWATLVAAPVLTLMYFELQFLPSHNESTTWWARTCMLADLALLWWMWPRAISRTTPGWLTAQLAPWGFGLMILLTASTSYVAILMATFPGEWLDTALWTFPGHESLIVGTRETGGDKRLLQPIWPNRLFVQGIDAVDRSKYDTPAKLAVAQTTKSMRDRHLEYAIIIEAQLARADFSGAHLQGASLVRAHAMGAWFDHADLSGAQLDNAELQGASFFAARLAGATMDGVQLQGGRLAGANLRAAWMHEARLDGASLAGADLRRATLDKSRLLGANLKEARLQGASLVDTGLEAASLDGAYISHTDFRQADAGRGLRHLNTSDLDEPPCAGAPIDACATADNAHTLTDLILRDIPESDSRYLMIERLKPLSSGQATWEKESQYQLENFKPLKNEDLVQIWENIACISKGAPFIIEMLIDTYDDEKGWTRPTTREATDKLTKYLLDQTQCTASLAIISESMRMDLRDLQLLRPPAPPQRVPSLLQIVSGLAKSPLGSRVKL